MLCRTSKETRGVPAEEKRLVRRKTRVSSPHCDFLFCTKSNFIILIFLNRLRNPE
ncbi:Uncharacterized protein dnm_081080 [Desulfonema magnum]|uniref:Uncharacterized protein n=1 Tax=Desulfonema magnum TaxID=45655 RepID=A0A975BVL0_9BACT|nr:Uncharacterized protein dnm_081080 [Desulfonema magnum]